MGADVLLSIAKLALQRIREHVIADDLHKANEALKYLHVIMGQLQHAGKWMKEEAREVKKEIIQQAKKVGEFMKQKAKS